MTRIQKRRGTAAEWAAANPVLAEGEDGYESDTGRSKIGNGEDQWGDLEYVGGLGVPTDYLTDNSGDYMVNDVVRYTDPAPSPTADLTGLYTCIVDHTSGSPKDYPARWKLVSAQSRVAIGAAAILADVGSYTYDVNGNVTGTPEGSTYAWESDGAGGYRVHTQTVGGTTRTFTYNTDGTIASVA